MAQAGPIALPGGTYPAIVARPVTSPQAGGASGPSDIPSRSTVSYPPAPPAWGGENGVVLTAPSIGWSGVTGYSRRSPATNDVALPEFEVANTNGHGTIAWSRPTYANVAGVQSFIGATGNVNASADALNGASVRPAVPIPTDSKRIDSATVNQEFGSTRALFPWMPPKSQRQQGLALGHTRRGAQSKIVAPYFDQLTLYQQAPAYGITTGLLGMGSY